MSTLLIVDDEPNVLYSLTKSLSTDELAITTASTAQEAIQSVLDDRPDAVILDVRLPDMSGLDAFDRIRQIDARLPVIIITAYSTTDTAIEATKRGAFEYMLKPIDLEQLHDVVQRALRISRLSHIPTIYETDLYAELRTVHEDSDVIIGRSPAMQEVYKTIGRIAAQDANVLVVGESGTGKELIAQAIYHHSKRCTRPFLAINCAALPDTLLESELFGHERGSFTGADRRRIGKFEQVTDGTILLDEIGDMSIACQAKMLRLLQDGTFERIGSNETISVDVRVIAATNKNLEQMVERGEFRRDLYYRLKVFSIEVPPLRERREDIPLLAHYLLNQFQKRSPSPARVFAVGAMEAFKSYHWPGNVRELQSVIKHALAHATGDVIALECLPFGMRQRRDTEVGSDGLTADSHKIVGIQELIDRFLAKGDTDLYRKVHAEIDRILIPAVLGVANGNQTQASQMLGISRSTLYTRMADLQLSLDKRVVETRANSE
jgi:two-component system nitrogen regulation response regulator GlnG